MRVRCVIEEDLYIKESSGSNNLLPFVSLDWIGSDWTKKIDNMAISSSSSSQGRVAVVCNLALLSVSILLLLAACQWYCNNCHHADRLKVLYHPSDLFFSNEEEQEERAFKYDEPSKDDKLPKFSLGEAMDRFSSMLSSTKDSDEPFLATAVAEEDLAEADYYRVLLVDRKQQQQYNHLRHRDLNVKEKERPTLLDSSSSRPRNLKRDKSNKSCKSNKSDRRELLFKESKVKDSKVKGSKSDSTTGRGSDDSDDDSEERGSSVASSFFERFRDSNGGGDYGCDEDDESAVGEEDNEPTAGPGVGATQAPTGPGVGATQAPTGQDESTPNTPEPTALPVRTP